ncbi:hypothetical protein JCM10450v2_002909 [Rhodotorula kratochvilovae]
MEDSHAHGHEGTRQSSDQQDRGDDRFSLLPPEVLSDIFSYLAPDPPLALSRRLLPYSRTSRLAHVEINTFRQLQRFADTLRTAPNLSGYVRTFAVALREPTEAILALETSFNDTLRETLALLPALKEVQAVNWMTTSFLLSENAAGHTCRDVHTLRLTVLLTQLTSLDFITYRLALLSRYPRLRKLEVMVLPFDPGSSSATAFDLFPASDLAPPALDMAPLKHIEQLVLGGALCDQRVVNVLRAFQGVAEVVLLDSFTSRHIAPALAALDTSAIRTLILQRLVGAPPPVDLPPQETDWTRFANVHELVLGMPIPSPEALALALPSFANLVRVGFGAGSDPSAALVQHLLAHRPPLLRQVVLSHVTGEVGAPLSPAVLPSVALWLEAVRAAAADPEGAEGVAPVFPLLDWRLPAWTPSFTPSDAEALFPLARAAGVLLMGSVVSACLTSFVLERQMDVWLAAEGDDGEMGDEEREVMGRREFWDALALRYRARLLGEEARAATEGGERMDQS